MYYATINVVYSHSMAVTPAHLFSLLPVTHSSYHHLLFSHSFTLLPHCSRVPSFPSPQSNAELGTNRSPNRSRSSTQGSKDGSGGTPCLTPFTVNRDTNRDSIGSVSSNPGGKSQSHTFHRFFTPSNVTSESESHMFCRFFTASNSTSVPPLQDPFS